MSKLILEIVLTLRASPLAMDPNLHRHLSEIEEKLDAIKKGPSVIRTIMLGIASGAGYIIGGIIMVFIIGLILNMLGLIPGLGTIVDDVRHAVQVNGR